MKKWKPKLHQMYWAVGDRCNHVYKVPYTNDRDDAFCISFGNCFRTKAEAQKKLSEIKTLLK